LDRRLTTIVAADVAGFSRLIAADEETTLRTLAALRADLIDPLLSEHAGRVANTAGDSLLIEFPSAVSAMRCAVALQAGMAERNRDVPDERRIVYRIGVNVGDVVMAGGDLLGDGVNVAARLEQSAAPGEILISRSVRDAVRDRLDLRLEDLGAIEVKNIPRPVRAFRVLPAGAAAQAAPPRARRPGLLRPAGLAALASSVVAAVAAGGWLAWSALGHGDMAGGVASAPAPLGEQSIAVLPFDADEADAQLGEGLAEDITGVLSLFVDLSVIASDSTAVYAGERVQPQRIARDLGVAHLLSGSVERQGETVRVQVRLLEGDTGRQVWAQRYEADGADIFSVRDSIARSIAAQLGESFGPLAAATLAGSKRKDTEALEAYELVLMAAELRHRFVKADNEMAADLLEKALQIDPRYARAHADLAWTHWQDILNGFTDDPAASFAAAIANARKAVEADPNLSDGYWVLGALSICEDDTPEDAVPFYETAIELNPNHQSLLTEWGGYILAQTLDRADEGVALVERALRLNPRHPDWYDGAYVSALYFADRPEDAVKAYAAVDQPQLMVRVYHLASLGQLGRTEEARSVLETLRELKPELSLSTLSENPELCVGAMSDDALAHLRDGLRKAGLPE
jgi:class 3 adenylate cyclase/TolB-like protein